MRYAIVIEGTEGDYSAYVPDLPGCVAASETLDDLRQAMQVAIQMHLEGLAEDNLPIPPPITQVDYVEGTVAE